MAKRIISRSNEAEVLKRSARRCCLCYGLEGDFSQKSGQVAHVDHDSANSKIENLVFLCLSHHDEYDSKTSQSKGITTDEVNFYRGILYSDVANQLPRLEPIQREQSFDEVDPFHQFILQLRNPSPICSSLLNGYEIQRSVDERFIDIRPFSPDRLRMSGCVLSMGEYALVGNHEMVAPLDGLVISPNRMAIVCTEEFMVLPRGLDARLNAMQIVRGHSGILCVPTRVEAGHSGRIFLCITNNSRKKCRIRRGDPLASIEFHLLNIPPWDWRPERPGPYPMF